MAKKYSLTDEHRAQLKPWADRWVANAMSTKPMDEAEREIMRSAIKGLYQAAGLTPPPDHRIIFVSSPFVARFAGGFASGIWWARKNKESATRDATDAATRDATYAATRDAIPNDLSKWFVLPGDLRAVARAFGNEKFLLQCAANAWRMWQGGNQWSAWAGFISFFRHVAKLDLPIYEKWQHWELAAIHGGPRMMHAEFCIFSDRPVRLTVDAQNRPHADTGPFCEWRDGSRLYAWHGIRVPAWCIEEKHKITKETLLAERNTEIRRAMCEIIGWSKALEAFGGEVIHTDECLGLPRKLIETDIGGERVRLLHMVNGTVEHGERREFVEGVPIEISTCHDAVAWQYGLSSKTYREGVRT